METVIGVLPSKEEADKVVHEFELLGIARPEIKVVPAGPLKEIEVSGRHPRGQQCPYPCGRAFWQRVERSKRSNAAAARLGMLRGAVFGFVTGALLVAAPGG